MWAFLGQQFYRSTLYAEVYICKLVYGDPNVGLKGNMGPSREPSLETMKMIIKFIQGDNPICNIYIYIYIYIYLKHNWTLTLLFWLEK